jgi:hypothetical protein
MKRKHVIKSQPGNVLHRIKRGLRGYVSYLAACEMNEAFSEYVLYEPILRIITARSYTVRCEYAYIRRVQTTRFGCRVFEVI